jgi:hypothetical protein
MTRTKVDAALEAAAEKHANDPDRADVLRRTRLFKASWVELGEALTEVRRRAQYKAWGFSSFEEYAQRELHLRQETVDKLTGSFMFLKKHAPQVLTRDGLSQHIPSYQAVDFLRRAEEQPGAPEEAIEAVRKRVLEDVAPLQAVAKQFREVVFPLAEGERKERDVAALLNVAGRLRELLGDTRAVPRKLAGEVSEALDRLLDAVRRSSERAA